MDQCLKLARGSLPLPLQGRYLYDLDAYIAKLESRVRAFEAAQKVDASDLATQGKDSSTSKS
jgi:hypothetical protein